MSASRSDTYTRSFSDMAEPSIPEKDARGQGAGLEDNSSRHDVSAEIFYLEPVEAT
jgi:hypothetical protein